MSSPDPFTAHLQTLGQRLSEIESASIRPAATAVENAWRENQTIFIAGNGGSANTALHLATDLCKTTIGTATTHKLRIRAIALTGNVGVITAWSNDVSFDHVFAEQIRNLGQSGDLLILLSASGASPNLLTAARVATEIGIRSLSLAPPTSTLTAIADVAIPINAETPQLAEDLHLAIGHAITIHMRGILARS